jgi:septum formation protein
VKRVVRNELRWSLASASPRRNEILNRLGLRFRVDPSGIREPARKNRETPSQYAVRIACLKAEEVAERHSSGRVIGVDTIVVLGNSILAKPESRADARSMLERLSGRWHEVLSGICLIDCAASRTYSDFGRSRVHFRRLSPGDIEWYLNTGEYRDKAGAYGVQGYAALLIDRIEGCYFNIVGFPVTAFQQLCKKSGIDLMRELKPIADCRMQIAD